MHVLEMHDITQALFLLQMQEDYGNDDDDGNVTVHDSTSSDEDDSENEVRNLHLVACEVIRL